jgi:hypothetical protein
MLNTITYKQILTYFSSIAFRHEQINSFGFGDIEQCTNDIITKQEPLYTRMYIVPASVVFNDNHIHYNFSIIIMDRVDDDLSNLEEVMSDTLEICMDIWTVFWQSYTEAQGDFSDIIMGDWAPDINPFTERFETTLGGWTMNIKMSAPFDYNSCNLPIVDNFGFPQDESYSSYKQILVDWQRFADAHEQLNSYGFGPLEQLTVDRITKVEPKYPRLYFVPETTTLNEGHMHVTWNVMICDKVNNDLSNLQDVLSDTLEIAKDFFAKAYLSDYDAEFNSTLEPWLERTETILGGWTLSLNVQQKFDYNRCVLPITSFTPGLTWEQLMEMWMNVNNKWNKV